jgi:5-formyltetrahydrofolate cyclo-ligase
MAQQNEKKALRARLRQRLRALDAGTIHDRSQAAAERLVATEAFRGAGAVMLFLPLAHEADARPIALRAWQQGKTVTVPLVSYEQKHMLPVTVRSLDEPMETDGYGVRSPQMGEPYPVELIDLMVVPGLGFDEAGQRIGRGGGFYDRFLSQPEFHGVTCGLALDEQVIDSVPVNAHDVQLDMLTTDQRVLRFDRSSAGR